MCLSFTFINASVISCELNMEPKMAYIVSGCRRIIIVK